MTKSKEPSEVRRFEIDIAQIKKKWNQAFEQKENWAEKRKETGRRISKVIADVKKAKAERNKLNEDIKKLKQERDKKNKETQELVEKAKVLNTGKLELSKKFNVKGDPGQIKRDLDSLNTKLETEALSFENEKKLMKTINDLKKQYTQVKEISVVWANLHELNEKIKDARKEAKKVHDQVQKIAEESEKKHNKVIEFSAQVDKLKEEETNAAKELEEKKKLFEAADKELNEKLQESAAIMQKKEEADMQDKSFRKRKEQEILTEKAKEVEEKISKKKKLTTEDLLAYQAKK